ncbi:MAG: DDE-type integrase/transposase/recombinase [Phycisphaeraceae bacterium]|nr:DDE-type integrase/transposase/recombinase [Phycisphaeraceae bacterium]
MRRITTQQRVSVVKALVEGCSIRATARMTGVSKPTILKLLLGLGRVCLSHEDNAIQMVECEHVEADEVWGFVHCKAKKAPTAKGGIDHVGDAWTWYAVDRKSKLILSWIMGDRDQDHARAFMYDLASRLARRPQLSTDSLGAYAGAVAEAFYKLGVDYGQVHKVYRASVDGARTYSPSECIACEKNPIRGNPDVAAIGTSRIERANLTLRMSQRRWTRLTNAHSKSFRHMEAAFALHACYYNWCRKHMTLGTTPAVAAGLTDREWSVADLVDLLEREEREAIGTEATRRGPYRKRS